MSSGCEDGPPGFPPPVQDFVSEQRHQVAEYVIVACLALCVWDWLLALSDEVEMARRGDRRLRYFLHGAYLISRVCPIVYLVAFMVIKDTPLKTCRTLAQFIGAANILIMPAISSLFFFRLSAVYAHNKYIIILFGFCWITALGVFIYDFTTMASRYTGALSTQCFVYSHADAWGYIATAAYDTLMYVAISWRLASYTTTNDRRSRMLSFFSGDGLGWLSKVLLRSGQVYYFLTIGFSISNVVLIYKPSVPPEWRGLLLGPTFTIASIMACTLVRVLKLGQSVEPMTERAISHIVFRDIGVIPQQSSGQILDTIDDVGMEIGGIGGAWDIENPTHPNITSKEKQLLQQ